MNGKRGTVRYICTPLATHAPNAEVTKRVTYSVIQYLSETVKNYSTSGEGTAYNIILFTPTGITKQETMVENLKVTNIIFRDHTAK